VENSIFWLSILSLGIFGKISYRNYRAETLSVSPKKSFNHFALKSVAAPDFSMRLSRAEHAFATQALRHQMSLTKN